MTQKETIRYSAVQDIVIAPNGSPERFPPHWHNAAEFILARKEGCSYRVQDTVYTLSRGDLLLIWPKELHETLYAPEKGCFFVQFSSRLLNSHQDLSSSIGLMSGVRMLSLRKDPEDAAQISALMSELEHQYQTEDLFRETRCKILLYRILLRIAEYAFREKIGQFGQDRFSAGAWERIQAACAYIDSHYHEKISQKEVAGKVNLSSCYFSRLFGRYMQVSFPKYLVQVRVRAAAELLGKTALSVTECAYRAGFQSSSAFNNRFMETMGISPRDYRKLYRNIHSEAESEQELF